MGTCVLHELLEGEESVYGYRLLANVIPRGGFKRPDRKRPSPVMGTGCEVNTRGMLVPNIAIIKICIARLLDFLYPP